MRIVDRATFLALPAGTIFAKLPMHEGEMVFDLDAVAIKGETMGVDFVVQDLAPQFEGAGDSYAWLDVLERMRLGEPSPPVDYDCGCRDGLFDQNQLFAVWNKADATALVARLQQALAYGYS